MITGHFYKNLCMNLSANIMRYLKYMNISEKYITMSKKLSDKNVVNMLL